MQDRAKRVQIGYKRQARELIVEFPGGRVHLTTGLWNRKGQEVTAVSVEADGNRFAGDPEYWADCGEANETGVGLRIIKAPKAEVSR